MFVLRIFAYCLNMFTGSSVYTTRLTKNFDLLGRIIGRNQPKIPPKKSAENQPKSKFLVKRIVVWFWEGVSTGTNNDTKNDPQNGAKHETPNAAKHDSKNEAKKDTKNDTTNETKYSYIAI